MSRWRWYVLYGVAFLMVLVYGAQAVGCPMGTAGCVGTAEPITIERVLDIPGAIVAALFGVLGNIVDALMGVVAHIVGLLPDMPDLGIPDLSGWMVGFSWWDTYLPLHEALAGTGLILALIGASFAWRVAVTIYHLIPKPGMGT